MDRRFIPYVIKRKFPEGKKKDPCSKGLGWGFIGGNLWKSQFEVKKSAIRCTFPTKYAEKLLEEGCGSRILLQ
ncbi:MAG: hypothetical protein ETSY1_11840 [Candidatus Entotheonella factor]|uniref:Uncharacterized protein n=1 Tax=Entotheonella factor TaxID=1429438 RepID=W4LQX0_ENTF1|nr:hypothetical protein [Candidatus Entotheonella palauensis]ETX00270.1 MAG: hypothetical protein ETSY1_11840 [Candidatus Entotheonella factor]